MLARRFFVSALTALVLAMGGLTLPAAPPTEAQSARLRTKSTSVFTLVPRKDRVDVVVDIAITNRTPSTVSTGPCADDPSLTCRITTSYVTSTWGFLAIQHGARKLRIRGQGASSSVANTNDTYTNHRLTFPPIRRGETARIRVTYQLPAASLGSSDSTRITEAYAHFCWHGQPTDQGRVIAVLPRGYEPTTQYANVRTRRTAGGVKLGPKRKGKPGRIYACTDSVDVDEVLETRTTSPSGQVITVRGWPEDPEWSEVVAGSVESTLPALESLIGTPIPGDDLTIIEVASQVLGGYAGDFSDVTGDVRVGEDTDDPIVVTHELAHAWFNRRTLDHAWMYEGAAEWAARQVNGRSCDWRDRPTGSDEVPRLRRWRHLGPDSSEADRRYVSAQYFLACDIYEDIERLVGEAGFRRAMTALLERRPKYGGTAVRRPPRPDWREWLDAVDELAMTPAGWTSTGLVEKILLDNGIARPRDLEGRSEARTLYHRALRGRLASAMPLAVRDLMDDWRFGKATTGLEIATEIMQAATEHDRANGTDTVDRIGRRLAAATDLEAIRGLRRAVRADPVAAASAPRRDRS